MSAPFVAPAATLGRPTTPCPSSRSSFRNACHPFYTGQQKFVDTGGRVQRFADKFGGAAQAALEKEKAAKAARAAKNAELEAAAKIEREKKAAEKAKRAAEYAAAHADEAPVAEVVEETIVEETPAE